MDKVICKPKKGLIIKTWERCRSIGRNNNKKKDTCLTSSLKRSVADKDQNGAWKSRVAPEGCFSVYVGPQKQRFVIKTEYVNHPLFQMLLEEAESEYGYNSKGPLALPCNVDLFYKVLVDMDYDDIGRACGFKRSYSSHHLLSPTRVVSISNYLK